jgi:flagellar capping protein FliD
MSKPNTVFNLGLRDVDLIEDAINSVIARRSSTMNMLAESTIKNTNEMSVYQEIKQEVSELRDLLGRLHNQKNWYRPKCQEVYVSG